MHWRRCTNCMYNVQCIIYITICVSHALVFFVRLLFMVFDRRASMAGRWVGRPTYFISVSLSIHNNGLTDRIDQL